MCRQPIWLGDVSGSGSDPSAILGGVCDEIDLQGRRVAFTTPYGVAFSETVLGWDDADRTIPHDFTADLIVAQIRRNPTDVAVAETFTVAAGAGSFTLSLSALQVEALGDLSRNWVWGVLINARQYAYGAFTIVHGPVR